MKLTVFDSNYLCHRAKYSRRQMTLRGYHNAVIHGFLHSLTEVGSKIGPSLAVFAWDGHSKHNVRRKVYPEYKAGREDKYDIDPVEKQLNELSYPQFWEIKDEVLPQLGFNNIFSYPHVESDDIMAQISQLYSGFDQIVLVTADNDMYQCIHGNKCVIFNPATGQIINQEVFCNTYGLPDPALWAMVKSIAGCSSDNVKGVNGIGEKRAIAYITGKMVKSDKYYQLIEKNEAILDRNVDLVTLPHPETPISTLTGNEVDATKFMDVCMKLNMKSLTSQKTVDGWVKAYGSA